ncbi:MAG: NAD(P)-dependent dehydrogenase (short-subunit alcohol dehydrogenase family) [Chlamydiales bacterium]|jgi:NAD(P)-dependent dehydrogenase (short-subunit alcohol dehydrogenase family)
MASQSPVSLVTGATRGIGREIARTLAGGGARVHVVWFRSESEQAELEREFPGRVHQADVTDEDQVRELVARIVEADQGLDVLVHAVGDVVFGPLADVTRAEFDHLFLNNVTSAFMLASAAREVLRASAGCGLFLGCAGIESLRARTATAAYTAAKTALLVLMRSLAREEAPFGVRFNMVSPGLVPHDGAHDATLDAQRLDSIPLGRPGSAGDLARAALWLTSPEAGHVTGQNIDVAGGYML